MLCNSPACLCFFLPSVSTTYSHLWFQNIHCKIIQISSSCLNMPTALTSVGNHGSSCPVMSRIWIMLFLFISMLHVTCHSLISSHLKDRFDAPILSGLVFKGPLFYSVMTLTHKSSGIKLNKTDFLSMERWKLSINKEEKIFLLRYWGCQSIPWQSILK